jgi:ribonuclease-3
MPESALDALQQRLGHSFTQAALLTRALTHRSFSADHNERLEFLGDAVLNLAVSELLYQRFSGSDEGDLTRVRAHLVREESLHRAALGLGLPQVVRLSDGEARGGGAQRASILADALEALIGATFIDSGFDAAHQVVRRLFGELIDSTETDSWSKDAKTELQEWLQARRLAVPSYPSPPRAARRMRRPSRSNAGSTRSAWPSVAKVARAAAPSSRPRSACSKA